MFDCDLGRFCTVSAVCLFVWLGFFFGFFGGCGEVLLFFVRLFHTCGSISILPKAAGNKRDYEKVIATFITIQYEKNRKKHTAFARPKGLFKVMRLNHM